MTTISTTKQADKESSIIDNIDYNVADETLTVTFKMGETKYRYSNVDENLFEAICNARSMGSYLTMNVFTNPRYQTEVLS